MQSRLQSAQMEAEAETGRGATAACRHDKVVESDALLFSLLHYLIDGLQVSPGTNLTIMYVCLSVRGCVWVCSYFDPPMGMM